MDNNEKHPLCQAEPFDGKTTYGKYLSIVLADISEEINTITQTEAVPEFYILWLHLQDMFTELITLWDFEDNNTEKQAIQEFVKKINTATAEYSRSFTSVHYVCAMAHLATWIDKCLSGHKNWNDNVIQLNATRIKRISRLCLSILNEMPEKDDDITKLTGLFRIFMSQIPDVPDLAGLSSLRIADDGTVSLDTSNYLNMIIEFPGIEKLHELKAKLVSLYDTQWKPLMELATNGNYANVDTMRHVPDMMSDDAKRIMTILVRAVSGENYLKVTQLCKQVMKEHVVDKLEEENIPHAMIAALVGMTTICAEQLYILHQKGPKLDD